MRYLSSGIYLRKTATRLYELEHVTICAGFQVGYPGYLLAQTELPGNLPGHGECVSGQHFHADTQTFKLTNELRGIGPWLVVEKRDAYELEDSPSPRPVRPLWPCILWLKARPCAAVLWTARSSGVLQSATIVLTAPFSTINAFRSFPPRPLSCEWKDRRAGNFSAGNRREPSGRAGRSG